MKIKTNIVKNKVKNTVTSFLVWCILALFLMYILSPLIFMITASFMPSNEITSIPYPWIPRKFYWQNYWKAIQGNDGRFLYVRNIANSFIVSFTVTVSTVLLSTLAGYGLAKFKFRGRKIIIMTIIATMMVPFQVVMIPVYLVIRQLELQDSYAGLILPFLVNAFGIFLMRQYFITFPDELLDAARIDGANELQVLRYIVFPGSWPAMVTVAIITFRTQWDNLIWPLLVAQSRTMQTIPVYITLFAEEKYTDEGAMMAAAVIASIPVAILFVLFSRYFFKGAQLFSAQKG